MAMARAAAAPRPLLVPIAVHGFKVVRMRAEKEGEKEREKV
jgi:hypothetical protein